LKLNQVDQNKIRSFALSELGFLSVGFAKAEFMEEEARHLEQWLNQNLNGSMSYMENHFDKRVDPRKLVPGSKTVISLLFNYYTPEKQEDNNAPKISMYAFGRDYHKVIKKKLKHLLYYIEEDLYPVNGRAFVDSAPVLERDWAKRAGLGWTGKHTLLLHPKIGSYFFLAELVIDLELEDAAPQDIMKDYCGTCTKCIDACPTDAISPQGYLLDASKCISYLTIELKEAIPAAYADQLEDWMFGCDICQEVCPWNRFAVQHNESDFNPKSKLLEMTKLDWMNLEEAEFDELFLGSPVKRAGFAKLKQNIQEIFGKKKPDQS